MKKELVSIVIPAYNAQKYMGRCLDSLVGQEYKNIEIIVVNDGSRDQTEEICQNYAKRDERVKLITIENGGVSNARNVGIQSAKGTYVMFVDSDDYVESDYVCRHLQAIQDMDADWAVSGFFTHYENTRDVGRIPGEYAGVYEAEAFGETFLWLYRRYFINSVWNKIYVRKLIKNGFDTELSLGEDLVFNLNYMETMQRAVVMEDCLYHYMCDEQKDSLTQKVNLKNIETEMANYERILHECQKWRITEICELEKMHQQNIISMIFGMGKKKLTKEEQEEILNAVMGNECTMKCMKELKAEVFTAEIIRKNLLKHRIGGIRRMVRLAGLLG